MTALAPIELAQAAHVMVNDAGDRFFPDSLSDALMFATEHGARFADPEAAFGFLLNGAWHATPDPGPGPRVLFHYAPGWGPVPGCQCLLIADRPEGRTFTPPESGCRVHRPPWQWKCR